jgi:hypothetical protein
MRKITQWMLVGLVALSMAACSGGSPEAQLIGNTYRFASFSEGEGLAEARASIEAELAALPPAEEGTAEASADPFASADAGLSEEAMAAANKRQGLEDQLESVAAFYNMMVSNGAQLTFKDDKTVEMSFGQDASTFEFEYPNLSENGNRILEFVEVTADGATVNVYQTGTDKPMGQYKLAKVQ